MILRIALAFVCAGCFHAGTLSAQDELQYRNPNESRGAQLATIVHDYRDQRIARDTDNQILIGLETHSFTGSADDLNMFIQRVSALPNTGSITVIFTGPQGSALIEPLTASAAQSGVDYDWSLQICQGDITICVPLAARIPFAQVVVPQKVHVEVGVGAPDVVDIFAQLHNRAADAEEK